MFEVLEPALPTILHLLRSPDEEVITDACWALSFLSDDCVNQHLDAIIKHGLCNQVIEILANLASRSPTAPPLTPALRVVVRLPFNDKILIQLG